MIKAKTRTARWRKSVGCTVTIQRSAPTSRWSAILETTGTDRYSGVMLGPWSSRWRSISGQTLQKKHTDLDKNFPQVATARSSVYTMSTVKLMNSSNYVEHNTTQPNGIHSSSHDTAAVYFQTECARYWSCKTNTQVEVVLRSNQLQAANHMVRHPRCVFINSIGMLSNV